MKKLMAYLKQKSTWTGAGSLVAIAAIFGIDNQIVQTLGAAIIAILNLFDLLRDEDKK